MRILITGARGLLGSAAQVVLPELGFEVLPFTHAQLDITAAEATSATLRRTRPDVVLNCAAFTRVDDAETHFQQAMELNALAAGQLARACAEIGARIVYPSTDYVFDGNAQRPYRPDDATAPLNAYGRSKLSGEVATRAVADHLVVRTSWLFGGGGPNFVRTIAQRLRRGEATRVVNDQTGRPTYARDAVVGIARLLLAAAPAGTYHIANAGTATWFELAFAIAQRLGREDLIAPCASREYPRPARRPAWSVLDSTEVDRLIGLLRPWEDALDHALAIEDF